MITGSSHITVPASLPCLHPVITFVEKLAEAHGFDQEERMGICLALEEMFANSAGQGYIDCGVMLGIFPGDVDFKQMAGKVSQRESGVLSYQGLGEPPARLIHPPLRAHKQCIPNRTGACGLCPGTDAKPVSGPACARIED